MVFRHRKKENQYRVDNNCDDDFLLRIDTID